MTKQKKDTERPSTKQYRELIPDRDQDQRADGDAGKDLRKVIIFRLCNEWYGVLLSEVFEIVDRIKSYQIPCMPPFIKGVINLRGDIVSIIDLKIFFGIGEGFEKEAAEACYIIAKCDLIKAGFMVDFVEDVHTIDFSRLDAPISTLDKIKAQYLEGEIQLEDRFLAIINIRSILEVTSQK